MAEFGSSGSGSGSGSGITGSGTAGRLAKFTTTSNIGDSLLVENSTSIEPPTDGGFTLGSNAKRVGLIRSTGFIAMAAVNDTQPAGGYYPGYIQLGPGGSTTNDILLARAAASQLLLSDGSTGGMSLNFQEKASSPSATSNTGKLFVKDASGVSQLFYLADDGTETQLTGTGGTMTGSGTSGKLAKFTGASSVGDSIVSESGTVVTVAGDILMPNNKGLYGKLSGGSSYATVLIDGSDKLLIGGDVAIPSLQVYNNSISVGIGTSSVINFLATVRGFSATGGTTDDAFLMPNNKYFSAKKVDGTVVGLAILPGDDIIYLGDASGGILKTVINSRDIVIGNNSTTDVRIRGDALGVFETTPVAKQTVSGVKLPSDTVMASLLTALAAYGLITDSTT